MASSRNRSNILRNKQVSTENLSNSNNFLTCGNNYLFGFNTASQAYLLKSFSNLSLKLHSIIANIWFNRQCLNNKVTPTYAKIQIKHSTYAARLTQQNAQILRIKNEIRSQHIRKDKLNKQLLSLHLQLVNVIQTENFLTFYNNIKKNIDKQMRNKYIKLRGKLDKLLNKNRIFPNETNFHARTVNLSDTNFTTHEVGLLDKGLKYNLFSKNRDRDMEQLTVDTEVAINKLPIDQQTHARHSALDILHKINNNLTKSTDGTDHRTLQQIKIKLDNNNLTVTKADKGNATVILKTTEYIQKTTDFINSNGYKQINNTRIEKYQTDIRNCITRSPLIIPPHTKHRFLNSNPSFPTLKALPKIHKPGIPIRPVVNYRPAPAYKLSKHLATTIKDLANLEDNHIIKNSHELTTLTEQLTLNSNCRLISLDVTNLYTSIPIYETLDTLEEKLLLNHDRQTVNQLINLLRTTLKQNFFSFNNVIYSATDGLGMGHPTSAIMSEVFMQSLEDVYVPAIVEKFGVIFYKRYVDDCFVIVESKEDITDKLMTYMNNLHKNIEFTIETETDGQLNFMDLTITRTNKHLDYSIFRKPTATDHTIHSSSNHPSQHKLAAYRSMIYRLNTIPMTQENYSKELNTIYEIAHNNGYNKKTIDKLQRQFNTNTTKQPEKLDNADNQWTSLTYIGKETYRLTNFFNKHNIKTSFRTNNNLVYKLKSKPTDTNIFDNSGIYKLTCKDCDQVYIGRTGRNLKTRYKEHLRSFTKNRTDSNYANHLLTHGHEPDSIDNSMTLLHKQSKGHKLNTLERLEIYKHKMTNRTIINEQLNTNSDVLFSVLKPRTSKKRKRDDSRTDIQNRRPKF